MTSITSRAISKSKGQRSTSPDLTRLSHKMRYNSVYILATGHRKYHILRTDMVKRPKSKARVTSTSSIRH